MNTRMDTELYSTVASSPIIINIRTAIELIDEIDSLIEILNDDVETDRMYDNRDLLESKVLERVNFEELEMLREHFL